MQIKLYLLTLQYNDVSWSQYNKIRAFNNVKKKKMKPNRKYFPMKTWVLGFFEIQICSVDILSGSIFAQPVEIISNPVQGLNGTDCLRKKKSHPLIYNLTCMYNNRLYF